MLGKISLSHNIKSKVCDKCGSFTLQLNDFKLHYSHSKYDSVAWFLSGNKTLYGKSGSRTEFQYYTQF